MQSTDAATGNFTSTREHYDLLIGEGNDPVLDPPELKAYMDGWDGEALFEELRLSPACRVLEIGVGTGRLALRTLERGCSAFTGMDLSDKTLQAARRHLAGYENVRLLKGEFPHDAPEGPFDCIYSSLTFMHIPDQRAACLRIGSLLAPGGRCVLSLDKEQSGILDMGTRIVRLFPSDPRRISAYLTEAGLLVRPIRELERAWLAAAERL